MKEDEKFPPEVRKLIEDEINRHWRAIKKGPKALLGEIPMEELTVGERRALMETTGTLAIALLATVNGGTLEQVVGFSVLQNLIARGAGLLIKD